jgi:hypothetical protein
MAFKMKGSAFKLNNVATKSALKQKDEESKHGRVKTPYDADRSSQPPSALKDIMKSPLEQQLAASNIEQEKLLGNTPVSSGGDFSVMTPAWVGDPEAHKDIDKKQKRLRELWETYSQGTSSDAESKEYEDLSDELKEYDRQWNQSQEDLSGGHIGEGGEGSISAGWPVAWNRKEEMEGE